MRQLFYTCVVLLCACKPSAEEEPPTAPDAPTVPSRTPAPDAGLNSQGDPTTPLGPFRTAADVPHGTPLHTLLTEGLCHDAEGHDFIFCSADHLAGQQQYDGLVAVGRNNELHVAQASGATHTGDTSTFTFADAAFYGYRRQFYHSNPPPITSRLSAPGYGRSGKARYVACGPAILELRPIDVERSREILGTWKLNVPTPAAAVEVRRAEDGTIVAEVTRSAVGIPRVEALYAGMPGKIRRLDVVQRNIVADGGSVVYDLPRGGRVYFKAYLALFEEGAPAVEYPDGTRFEKGMVPADFEWSVFQLNESSPKLKLYVASEDEVAATKRELEIVTPAEVSVLGPCSAALGAPEDPDAITNPDGSPRPFGSCDPDDRHVCMGVGRVGFEKFCQDSQCYFRRESTP